MHFLISWKFNLVDQIQVCLVLGLLVKLSAADTLYIPPGAVPVSSRVVFTYYPDQLPWNRAQEVCRRMHGGSLATLDNYQTWRWILNLTQYDWENTWDHSWVGLHWANPSDVRWADQWCQQLNDDSRVPYKDTSQEEYKADHRCYCLDSGSVSLEQRHCDDDFGFICQHFEYQPTTLYEGINMGLHAVDMSQFDVTDCNATCDQILGCLMTSQAGNSTMCIVGVVGEENTGTYTKILEYRGAESTLATSLLDYVNILISEVNEPLPCVPMAAHQTGGSHGGNLTILSNMSAAEAALCFSSSATQSASVTSSPCLNQTVTVTSVNHEPNTALVTLTVTETSHHPVVSTAVQTLMVTATNVITEQLNVVSTLIMSQHCSSSDIVCPAFSCPSSEMTYESQSLTEALSSKGLTLTKALPTTLFSMSSLSTTSVNKEELYRELTQSIINELKIDSKSTSKSLARLNSAPDPRQSSQAIGIVAIAFMTILSGLIILIDLPSCIICIHDHVKSLRDMLRDKHM